MRAQARDGRSVLPRGRKTRGLLAVLAVCCPRPVLRDELTALLWSQREREQGRASLRQAIHDLQTHLLPLGDDILMTDRNYLALARSGLDIDVQAVARATADTPGPLRFLLGAEPPCGLLRDLAGIDPAFDRWIETERARILRGAVTVAEAVLARSASPQAIVAAAEQLLSLEPAHEAGWRALMSGLVAAGDRPAAIAAFGRCSAALAEAAQLGPSAETRALLDAIRGEIRVAPAAPLAQGRPSAPPPPRSPDGAVRLGVMPFRLLDPDGDPALAFGLAEEITTALSRFRDIALIASPSLAAVGPSPAASDLRSLDLDFMVDGTIQRGAQRVRIMVRLLDMRAGQASGAAEVIWARRFDRETSDLLLLQDEIAAETVAQIDPELLLRDGRRANSQSPRDGSAYDLMLRAIPAVYRLEEDRFLEAGGLLAAAVALEPEFAAAHAWWAYWHVFLVGQGWAKDPDAAMTRAGELAERALALDPSDARAVTIAGHVRAFLHHRIDEAVALHERALSLNPNLPLAWVLSGLAHVYAGHHDEAVRRIEQARRLSPFDPHSFFFDMALTLPLYCLGRYEAVVELGRRVAAVNPSLSSTYKGYLAALGQLTVQGDMTVGVELVAVRDRLLQLEPGFTVREALARSPLQRAPDRLAYAEGLRAAGLARERDAAEPAAAAWHENGPFLLARSMARQ